MVETKGGVYKTRTGNHGERLIQVPILSVGYYRRYVNDETGEIRFVKVE